MREGDDGGLQPAGGEHCAETEAEEGTTPAAARGQGVRGQRVAMPQTPGQACGGEEGTPRMNRVVKTATYLLLMPSPVRQMI